MSDFYSLLGVERDATDADIKKAYRKLAMELPSRPQLVARRRGRFKEVTEAYEVLRDPQKRAAYDRYGKAGVGRGGAGFEYHHVDLTEALNIFMRDFGGLGGFESLFGGGGRPDGGGGAARAGHPGHRPDDARRGGHRRASAPSSSRRSTRCEHCGGTRRQEGHQRRRAAAPAAATARCGARPAACSASSSQVAPCPTCGGEGTVIRTPCEVCRGEGRVRAERTVPVEIPAGVSTNNYLTHARPGRRGARATAARATCCC